MDDDEDFLPDDEEPRQLSGSTRLRAALIQARRSLSLSGSSTSQRQISRELASQFPFASTPSNLPSRRGSKRKRLQPWKVLPCCLEGPGADRVPTRSSLDRLCKLGLGVLWFTREDMLHIPTYLSSEELHFLLVCLFPLLKNMPYEFCKAAGPGNNVIVPLPAPKRNSRNFVPFETPDVLKRFIGRKGKLYIRPLRNLDVSTQPLQPEHVVYLPKTHLQCVYCSTSLPLLEVPDHRYFCSGSGEDSAVAGAGTSVRQEESTGVAELEGDQANRSVGRVAGSSGPSGESTPAGPSGEGTPPSSSGHGTSAGPSGIAGAGGSGGIGAGRPSEASGMEEGGNIESRPEQSFSNPTSTSSDSDVESHGPPRTASGRLLKSLRLQRTGRGPVYSQVNNMDGMDYSGDVENTLGDNRSLPRDIIQTQNMEFSETLRIDQERDRESFFQQQENEERSREEVVLELESQDQALRVQEWHRRIRTDLRATLPPEPPEGLADRISVRLRLPDGNVSNRSFLKTDLLRDLFQFVGSLDPVNPRNFRLLMLNDGVRPKELSREDTSRRLDSIGFRLYTLVTVENQESLGSSNVEEPSRRVEVSMQR